MLYQVLGFQNNRKLYVFVPPKLSWWVGQLVGQTVGWSDDWWVGRSVGWMIGGSDGWWVGGWDS